MSDGKVVSLNGGHAIGSRDPSPVLIETLEDLLEKARSGEIVGMAGSYLFADHQASYFLSGFCGGFGLIGGLDVARAHLVDPYLDEVDG